MQRHGSSGKKKREKKEATKESEEKFQIVQRKSRKRSSGMKNDRSGLPFVANREKEDILPNKREDDKPWRTDGQAEKEIDRRRSACLLPVTKSDNSWESSTDSTQSEDSYSKKRIKRRKSESGDLKAEHNHVRTIEVEMITASNESSMDIQSWVKKVDIALKRVGIAPTSEAAAQLVLERISINTAMWTFIEGALEEEGPECMRLTELKKQLLENFGTDASQTKEHILASLFRLRMVQEGGILPLWVRFNHLVK